MYYYMMGSMPYMPYTMNPYDEFIAQYANLPQEDIWDEMYKLKNQVPQNLIQQYIHELDYFMETGTIYSPEQIETIDKIKDILMESSTLSAPQTQYVSGTSLLLWFLILTAIWPKGRPYPYPRPCPPYCPRPYSF
ncbi:hypothetical protein [Inediibacterium massiliense]|uniref:hypothetical protein n=1 Tax=Inediibacterium massiliense TaxID=1658111 RepID=UPI0006B4C3E7|nr:hypothetical protein [Inediibacterium massiliense]